MKAEALVNPWVDVNDVMAEENKSNLHTIVLAKKPVAVSLGSRQRISSMTAGRGQTIPWRP